MTTPIVYKSTDASAPTLSGTAGDMVNLLDKILCDGYGAKAAAGWTKAFTASSKRAYRQAGGNQFYLMVDDSLVGAATKEANINGFEVMTAIGVGTGQFPNAAQTQTTVRKSTTADATTRAWVAIADDRTFYLFVLTGDTASTYHGMTFGDMFSVLSGDPWRTVLIANAGASPGSNAMGLSLQYTGTAAGNTTAVAGNWIARNYTGFGGATQILKHGDGLALSASVAVNAFTGVYTFPNPVDGLAILSRVFVADLQNSLYNRRGYLRGFWHFCHPVTNVADGDTFSGGGDLAGRTFMVIKSSFNSGLYIVETSAWDTSS